MTDEAASIDGCNAFQVFAKILVPLTRSTCITIAILSSVFWWNELTQPVFFTNSKKWRTLTVALMTSFMYTPTNIFAANWPSVTAASTLMILPPMILYLVGSKAFVNGIKTFGLKL